MEGPKPNSTSCELGIGLDSCITKVADDNYLIQTTDYFTPIVHDPYLQGRISACNVLSDLYACGISKCDNILMILASSTKFSKNERDVIMPLMIKGFNETCQEANTVIRGGHTILNPWPLIGGAATAVTKNFVDPTRSKAGDVLILTKPLGTQIAVNMYQWRDENHKFYSKLKQNFKNLDLLITQIYNDACFSMSTLNKYSAEAMLKFNSHGATDVTGFGILGHATNLAKVSNNVHFEIHSLPILDGAVKVDKMFGKMFKLVEGYSAETSGGLLLSIGQHNVEEYLNHVEKFTKIRPWVIGRVLPKTDKAFAKIVQNVKIINISGIHKN